MQKNKNLIDNYLIESLTNFKFSQNIVQQTQSIQQNQRIQEIIKPLKTQTFEIIKTVDLDMSVYNLPNSNTNINHNPDIFKSQLNLNQLKDKLLQISTLLNKTNNENLYCDLKASTPDRNEPIDYIIETLLTQVTELNESLLKINNEYMNITNESILIKSSYCDDEKGLGLYKKTSKRIIEANLVENFNFGIDVKKVGNAKHRELILSSNMFSVQGKENPKLKSSLVSDKDILVKVQQSTDFHISTENTNKISLDIAEYKYLKQIQDMMILNISYLNILIKNNKLANKFLSIDDLIGLGDFFKELIDNFIETKKKYYKLKKIEINLKRQQKNFS